MNSYIESSLPEVRNILHTLSLKKEINVEMVCLGNICRSPIAAAVLHNRAEEISSPLIKVSSSGTANYHEGESAHHLSEKVWSEAGYSYTHRARQFKSDFFNHADLILCMDLTNRAIIKGAAKSNDDSSKVFMLRQFDPLLNSIDPNSPDGSKLTVPDPWGKDIEAFHKVLEMIERSISGLLLGLSFKPQQN